MPSPSPLRVVVAGGGFAAAEALLALRALARDRVALSLVTPQRRLAFRPAATAASFAAQPVQSFDLGALAADVGATLHDDAVAAVAPSARRLRTMRDAQLEYDALLLAVGARARASVPGALTFRDQRDAPQVAGVVDDLRAGRIDRLVLAAPAGVAWTLPLYELALYAAGEIDGHGLTATVTIVSPESSPLEVFGREGSAAVARLLRERDVRFHGSAVPGAVDRTGLRLAFGGRVAADRVIAVPALTGRRLPGIPSHDFSGFVQTDDRGRVEDLDGVWAAGDVTASPIKQGGLAAQQAEAAAQDIAALAGATSPVGRRRLVLRAKLLGGAAPLYLRAELDGTGRAVESGSVTRDEAPWWPDAKVFGRHVTPWMAEQAIREQTVAV
jgi:sulfide:quinone oxidoreductase